MGHDPIFDGQWIWQGKCTESYRKCNSVFNSELANPDWSTSKGRPRGMPHSQNGSLLPPYAMMCRPLLLPLSHVLPQHFLTAPLFLFPALYREWKEKEGPWRQVSRDWCSPTTTNQATALVGFIEWTSLSFQICAAALDTLKLFGDRVLQQLFFPPHNVELGWPIDPKGLCMTFLTFK